MANDKQQLLNLLRRLAFAKRDIVLASGQKSNFYIDCKQVVLRGEGHALIGALFYEMLKQHAGAPFEAVGGMALGAVPLSSALSMTAFQCGQELPVIIVRPKPKDHGTQNLLEGVNAVSKSAHVLIVEDVVTTGGSSIRAAATLRAGGFVVDTVFTVVDRLAGGEAALAQEGLKLQSLFTAADFL